MLLIYVYNEFSFDKFNTNNSKLYHVLRNQPEQWRSACTNSATPEPLAPAMIKDFPEIDKIARTNWTNHDLVNYKDKALKIGVMAADPAFLDMFTYQFVYSWWWENSLSRSLVSLVLTESSARSILVTKILSGR